MSHALPAPHPLPEIDAIRPYITEVVVALEMSGIDVNRSWLDPARPIDATIVIGDDIALVWDEWGGWVIGTYISGHQGERTVIDGAIRLLDGVEPLPDAVANATCRAIMPSVYDTDDFSTTFTSFIDA